MFMCLCLLAFCYALAGGNVVPIEWMSGVVQRESKVRGQEEVGHDSK
jgi:hypothetical protein